LEVFLRFEVFLRLDPPRNFELTRRLELLRRLELFRRLELPRRFLDPPRRLELALLLLDPLFRLFELARRFELPRRFNVRFPPTDTSPAPPVSPPVSILGETKAIPKDPLPLELERARVRLFDFRPVFFFDFLAVFLPLPPVTTGPAAFLTPVSPALFSKAVFCFLSMWFHTR